MSTPFNVRQWAAQAGIQTTGGFAVVAECVTQDELERFAQIAIADATKNYLNAYESKCAELDSAEGEVKRLKALVEHTYYINEAGNLCQRFMDNLTADMAMDILGAKE